MRLPAYGKKLKSSLDAGDFPSRVWVIWGDDWQRLPAAGALCIRPSEFHPERTDFRLLAGLRVDVVDREGGTSDLIYCCLAEIGAVASLVVLHHFDGSHPCSRELSNLMWCLRKPVNGVFGFPEYWSAVHQDAYIRRTSTYLCDLLDDILPKESAIAA